MIWKCKKARPYYFVIILKVLLWNNQEVFFMIIEHFCAVVNTEHPHCATEKPNHQSLLLCFLLRGTGITVMR